MVEVEFVVVELTPVKFCNVEEPDVRMLVRVPTEVREEATTLAASVVPVRVPAGAVPVMLPVRFPVALVKKRFDAKKFVEVAWVVVAFTPVKFCKVLEPLVRRVPSELAPETLNVVAKRFVEK